VPGRNTYDQVKKFGQWRHKGKRAYVLSSNQISTSNGEAKRAGAASKLIP
jgi:dihydrofolate reductase